MKGNFTDADELPPPNSDIPPSIILPSGGDDD